MPRRDLTIEETTGQIRSALREYIEAAYHVGNPGLVERRRALLEEEGVLFRSPYIESTPRYESGTDFADLTIPAASRELLGELSSDRAGPRLLHDPPYRHQSEALEATADGTRSVAVTTGTGSGKTEAFLLPILSRLTDEAAEDPESFSTPAVRALLLYPMNALVNDQLGRLRLLFGDERVVGSFIRHAGRPARFARYTSRTLYPGVRDTAKDKIRLKPIERFYLNLLDQSEAGGPEADRAALMIESLKERGKWPAKEDLRAWYGAANSHWRDAEGNFARAILRDGDSEELTRHEVLESPPDLLVTNYSMLEYMLMRPLERPVFEKTRRWLAEDRGRRLMLVVDEAHLYRGAAGAEVGLLLRRLRARLGIEPDRLQVISTSASFADPRKAQSFSAQLTGKGVEEFSVLTGTLAVRPNSEQGDRVDAEVLAGIAIDQFHEAREEDRLPLVEEFLSHRGIDVGPQVPCEQLLHRALVDFPPMGLLVNMTMDKATPVGELGARLFPGLEDGLADKAASALVALGSFAREQPDDAGMLPCRVHSFLRGLPGLWACLDPDCEGAGPGEGAPIGRLYTQPQASCEDCGARVFEFYTCRNCGAAYARAYTDDVEDPRYLWPEPGAEFAAAAGHVGELEPIDLLLEKPTTTQAPVDLDLPTGRLNPKVPGERTRRVYLRGRRSEAPNSNASPGQFVPCGVCGTSLKFGRSSVQDHQTKGDQPFQALLAEQIAVQPPGKAQATDFAPLRGRKVLVFSDSRQVAARLAPNLQRYSTQDALRPVLAAGWQALRSAPVLGGMLNLDDLYLAALVGADLLGVRIRPDLAGAESPYAIRQVSEALAEGALEDGQAAVEMREIDPPPLSMLRAMLGAITDRHLGLQALALGSLRERDALGKKLLALPDLPGIADTPEGKLALARAWIGFWIDQGIWFQGMGTESIGTYEGVRPHRGRFEAMGKWIDDPQRKRAFERDWLPRLLGLLCEPTDRTHWKIRAGSLALELGGDWRYCLRCRTPQRAMPGLDRCIGCGGEPLVDLDPDEDATFSARKGYYRRATAALLAGEKVSPMALVAAEHTAQLNAAQPDEVFSKAEEHELLFQDIDISDPTGSGSGQSAIDVLSCTTTMEVGIDIGALSGVSLRNLPPSRSSYQQRSGRAGRRGNATATVIAFGSADSHDDHYFRKPDAMIRGDVTDPVLTLDNPQIARRHLTAFLLQRYHQTRLPEIPTDAQPHLFEVLGSVDGFREGTQELNRGDFGSWLEENHDRLVEEAANWLPGELSQDDRVGLLDGMIDKTLKLIDSALGPAAEESPGAAEEPAEETLVVEAPPEVEEEIDTPNRLAENLLDRLLYKGVLPRYAFPTDVAAFHVFDLERSSAYRTEYRYAPSQGLPAALTQYAPGKEVWIDGKLWRSGAIFSPMRGERSNAWHSRRLYLECEVCGYAETRPTEDGERGQTEDCPACGSEDRFGAARYWLRPPGFAHPCGQDEDTSREDQPTRSYATRAKLVAPGSDNPAHWEAVTDRLKQSPERTHLLVTNTGPRREGYSYCTACGLIEPTATTAPIVTRPHPKPFPDRREPTCPGMATRGLVLGTDFVSDVLLLRLTVDDPVTLRPELLSTQIALRTLAEAITMVAAERLELEPGDLQAEHRPALSPGGHRGMEAEIYVYDTLPGGAGFAHRVGEMGVDLYKEVIHLLENCQGRCERSCYRCLRSFGNRFEHDLLDRHVGAALLRYLIEGAPPRLPRRRERAAEDMLFADLMRQGREGLTVQRSREMSVPGIGELVAPIWLEQGGEEVIVAVHDPLTPDKLPPGRLAELDECGAITVLPVDELIVSRNLPAASQEVLDALA
jgi:ATP-dependent helicase YprA (DUF1998 family)